MNPNADNPLQQMAGLPPFSAIQPEHIEPAIDAQLQAGRAQLKALTQSSQVNTFEDLALPLEQLGHRLNRLWSPVSHMNAVVNSDALREAYNACLPKLTEYSTEFAQNQALYQAYQRVHEGQAESLDPAQRRLLEEALRDFRLSGVTLEGEQKQRYGEVRQALSALQSKFGENVMDAETAWSRHITEQVQLEGLPEHVLERAAAQAEAKGLPGWLLRLDFPTYHAVACHAQSASLREALYRAWSTRASDQGFGPADAPTDTQTWDNTPNIDKILALRHELAQLVGFDNYAEYSLATKMAANVEEVIGFLEQLAARSVEAARAEMAALEAFAGRPLEPWDVGYYAEKLRKEKYDISDEMLRPYFPATRVTSGMFALVRELFGIEVREREQIDAWHKDVRFFDIYDAGTDNRRGGFYVDLFARPKKRGGAWMDECIVRNGLNGEAQLPVAYLVCNFTPPGEGRPALLTHQEVVTLFHEFGHTLHHLLTRVDYPSLAGINGVPWDAVELPSQFMENFVWTEQILPMISGHFETDEPLPKDLFERLLSSRAFNAGMAMVRQLEFALFDMRVHAEYNPEHSGQVADILAQVREQVSVVPVSPFNRFHCSFSHIFAGGYAAGYYSYKWAEVLSADAFSAFEQAGVLDTATGQRLMQSILEVGGTRDAMDAFVSFRGRKPDPEPLLRHNGLA